MDNLKVWKVSYIVKPKHICDFRVEELIWSADKPVENYKYWKSFIDCTIIDFSAVEFVPHQDSSFIFKMEDLYIIEDE